MVFRATKRREQGNMEGVRRGAGTRGSVRAAGRRGDVSGPDTLLHWGKGEQGNLGLVWVVSITNRHQLGTGLSWKR